MTLQNEYNQLAQSYDEKYSNYNQTTDSETLKAIGQLNGEKVLDLACGTGNLLKELKARFPSTQLTGVDQSSGMLQIARDKLDESISLYQNSATSLDFANESFDLVITNSAFHFFPEQEKALQEIQRVLKTNGRLVLTDWCKDFAFIKFYDWYLRSLKSSYSNSLSSSEMTRRLNNANFQIESLHKFKIGYTWGLMTITATKK